MKSCQIAIVVFATMCLTCRCANALARANHVSNTDEDRFVAAPDSSGVFAHSHVETLASDEDDSYGGGIAGETCALAIPGFDNPGAIVRVGDTVYVGDEGSSTIIVVDISKPGSESIIDAIETPVAPIDIAVVGDEVYVIDQDRNELHHRPLAGSEWTFIPLPNGTVTQWSYGSIMYPLGDDRMIVLHMWENLIDIVDLDSEIVELTITDVDHLPDRVVLTDEKMIVLGVGLDAPSCFANGPHFSVYDLSDFTKDYRRDLTGNCPIAIEVHDDIVYVAFNNQVRSYELSDGSFITSLNVLGIGRHLISNGTLLTGQNNEGDVFQIDYALTGTSDPCNALTVPQIWFPPLEEMVVLEDSDGRVLAPNRNDSSLSIIGFAPTPCPQDLDGDGTVGPADLALLLGTWGPCRACRADFDGSGVVDPADLALLLGVWGVCS